MIVALVPLASLRAQQGETMGKDKDSMQDHSAMAVSKPSAEGRLMDAGGHKASGTVHIVKAQGKHQLHFAPDVSIEAGPDVYVTLTNGPKPVKGASVTVGRLTRFAGEQSFDLPADADLAKYSHLVLWSKKHGTSVGQAKLQMAGTGMMDQSGGMEKESGAMMGKNEGAR